MLGTKKDEWKGRGKDAKVAAQDRSGSSSKMVIDELQLSRRCRSNRSGATLFWPLKMRFKV